MTGARFSAKIKTMGKLETIKKSLAGLSVKEQRELLEWFTELQERLFDEQIERDAKAGKLDFLIKEAIEEDEAGRTRPL
jgi:hypothetical protein